MDPLVEVRPAACLFLIGPQLARDSVPDAGRLSYDSIVRSGLAYLQERLGERFEVGRLEEKRRSAPLAAMQEIVWLLRTNNLYADWAKETFAVSEEQRSPTSSESLQWLLELHKQGAMLACTQYDTILDTLAQLPPVTISNSNPEFSRWYSACRESSTTSCDVAEQTQAESEDMDASEGADGAKRPGFLHMHGVQTDADSLRLFPYVEPKLAPDGGEMTFLGSNSSSYINSNCLTLLREAFQSRLVFLVGFDGEHQDPLLQSLLQLLYPGKDAKVLRNPPIFLTSSGPHSGFLKSELEKILSLRISSADKLQDVIVPGSSENFAVGKDHTDKPCDGVKVQAFLLFNEKQSFRKLGEVIYQQSKSGEIYVRRDALTVIFNNTRILYGNLVTYGGNGLRKLWELVFAEGSTLLGKGLVALGLQNAAIVWINSKPKGLGNITGINSVHTTAAHKAVHSMALAAQKPFVLSDHSLTTSAFSPASTPPSASATSHSRPPPFFTPVSAGPPLLSSSPPSSHSSTPPTDSPPGTSSQAASSPSVTSSAAGGGGAGGGAGGGGRRASTSTSSQSAVSVSSDTSSASAVTTAPTPILSSPPPLQQLPLALNSLSCFLVPNAATAPGAPAGASGGGATPPTQFALNLAPSTAPTTVVQQQQQQQQKHQPQQPLTIIAPPGMFPFPTPAASSVPVPFSILPAAVPLSQPPVSSHHQVAPFPVSLLPPTLGTAPQLPLKLAQPDLDTLTDLHSRISRQLNSMSSDDEGGGENAPTGHPSGAGGGDSDPDRPLWVSSTAITALPPEILNQLPGYELLLSRILTDSEHVIEVVDTNKSVYIPRIHSGARPAFVTALSSSSTSLSTAVKFPTATPRPSLIRGASSLHPALLPQPLSLPIIPPSGGAGLTSNRAVYLPVTSSALKPATPATASSSPPNSTASQQGLTLTSPVALNSYQYPFVPILLAPQATPTAAGPASSQPSLPGGYYIVPPTAIQPASGGVGVGHPSPPSAGPPVIFLGYNNYLQQLPSTASATTLQGGVASQVGGAGTPLVISNNVTNHQTVPAHNQIVVNHPPLLPPPLIASTALGGGAATTATPTAMPTGNQLPVAMTASTSGSNGSKSAADSGEGRRRGVKRKNSDTTHTTTTAKVFKTSSQGTDLVPTFHIRGVSTNQNHPRWSGDEMTKKSEVEDKASDESVILWQFLLDLLLTPNHGSLIQWTGKEKEFKIVDMSSVAEQWKTHLRDNSITLNKFKKSLDLSCTEAMLQKVDGKTFTYKFLIDIERYIIEHKSAVFTKISL